MAPQRRPIVGGNWKMNLHSEEVDALTRAIVDGAETDGADLVLCPPFCYLERVGRQLAEAGKPIRLGAQDVYPQPNGAFTGEVSVSMLRDLGVSHVIVGHSERRHVIGESDLRVNEKVRAGVEAGLTVILCVGETLEQREANQTDAINVAQVHYGLAGVPAERMDQVVVAYEPVWAIGTGRTAEAADAQSAQATIRQALRHMYGDAVADATRIQYGGSVKPKNAKDIFGQPDVDGGLIGGASLKSEDFLPIVAAAQAA